MQRCGGSRISWLVSVFALVALMGGRANAQFTALSNLSSVTQSDADGMLKLIGYGTIHRFYQPSASLGPWGFELSLQGTAVLIGSDTKTTIKKFTSSSVPAVLPVPALQGYLGFPLDIEAGFSWVGGVQDLSLFSMGVSWGGLKLPFMTITPRASFTTNKISFVKSSGWSLEVAASYPLGLTEPYIFLGMTGASANMNGLSQSALLTVATGISLDRSFTSMVIGAGVPLKLGFFHLRPEFQYYTAGVTSAGVKLAFVF